MTSAALERSRRSSRGEVLASVVWPLVAVASGENGSEFMDIGRFVLRLAFSVACGVSGSCVHGVATAGLAGLAGVFPSSPILLFETR